MNKAHHQGSVRCACWHSTNPRIILSGGDDRTIRLWRLYPHNALYQSNHTNKKIFSNTSSPKSNIETKSDNESEEDVELRYDDNSEDDDPNKFMTDFDPSIQPISHLLSMPASGEVKGVSMSPYNGEIVVATSSRKFNQRSSLDIIKIPHWTWNYTSKQRMPYKKQLKKKYKKEEKSEREQSTFLTINSLDDELNPFIENNINRDHISFDFVDRPSVIPLPYGARERCIAFSPSPDIVFVGLLSCRKKHQRRYCCLMACNISNGASRACRMINALLHRKECIYSVQLTSTNDKCAIYRLALGTNLGRLIIVTLKEDMSWDNTHKSFIDEYSIGFEDDPINISNKERKRKENKIESIDTMDKKRSSSSHHRKVSSKSMKYSVLTSRERCFREMADPITVMITFDSMKKYLWNESSQIDVIDIKEFFSFLGPNKKRQISFTQFVQRIDEDGNFMRAFEQFCLTGSSRTDRRAWMDASDDDVKEEETDDADIEWEFAMINHRGGDHLNDEYALTAIVWSKYDDWIVSGHQNGDIRFWSKETYPAHYKVKQNKYLAQSSFYYVCRGTMKQHSQSVSSLSLSGTYLVSSSSDGNILIWHLDFLLPSVSLPMNITSKGIVQLLSTISSAHLGDEISSVNLSIGSNNILQCLPNALYLVSSGADENVRCRDVMEILRQQLTERILAESQQQNMRQNHINNNEDEDDGSDFGATTYN